MFFYLKKSPLFFCFLCHQLPSVRNNTFFYILIYNNGMADRTIKKPQAEPVATVSVKEKELEAKLAKQQEIITKLQQEKIQGSINSIGKKIFGNDEKTGYAKYAKYISFPEKFDFTNNAEIEKIMTAVKDDIYVEVKENINDITYKPQTAGEAPATPIVEEQTTNESGIK